MRVTIYGGATRSMFFIDDRMITETRWCVCVGGGGAKIKNDLTLSARLSIGSHFKKYAAFNGASLSWKLQQRTAEIAIVSINP